MYKFVSAATQKAVAAVGDRLGLFSSSTPQFTYSPPGNQNDFRNPGSLLLWGQGIEYNYWNSIWALVDKSQQFDGGIAYRLPNPNELARHYSVRPDENPTKSYLQFRSTKDLQQMLDNTNKINPNNKAQLITKLISWNSFPKRIRDSSSNTPYEDVETPGWLPKSWSPNPMYPKARQMDEYCEWFTYRDAQTNKITRIDISCESPEYWEFLFQQEPDTALQLYRKYVSPDVQMDDLTALDPKTGNKIYNIYNDWNTTKGIMHLNCPPNSLFAEIYLAAEASTYWQKKGSNPVTYATDPQDLIKSGEYGESTRASDPTIGADINALIRKATSGSGSKPGLIVSVSDPVGLYLQDLDTTGWLKNNGEQFTEVEIKKVVTYQRGGKHPLTNDNLHLRIKIEIPQGWGYTLGDCSIGGSAIDWAGRVIDNSVNSFLIGAAIKGDDYIYNDADTKAIVPPKDNWKAMGFPPPEAKPLVPPPKDVATPTVANNTTTNKPRMNARKMKMENVTDVVDAPNTIDNKIPPENDKLYKELLESKEETLLPIDDIQGDSILGFNQPCSAQILLELVDITKPTVAGVKRWLTSTICPNITTTLQLRQHRDQHRATSFQDSTACFLNVSFSYDCIKILLNDTNYDVRKFNFDTSLPFCLPIKDRGFFIGDTLTDMASWEFGVNVSNHILLNISTNSLDQIEEIKQEILRGSDKFCKVVNTTTCFRGNKDEVLYGHEHFGFLDGLSQPEVRGKYEYDDNGTKKSDFIVRRKVVASDKDPRYKDYSQPGFRLLDTGHFVLGYSQDIIDTDGREGNSSRPALVSRYPAWCKNGSFVVYRKLAQHVPEFWEYMLDQAKVINKQNGLNLTEAKEKDLAGDIGAKCVGRWWDGTPLTFDQPVSGLRYPPETASLTKVNSVGKDVLNGFVFDSDMKPWKVFDNDGNIREVKPPTQNNYRSDANAAKCPFAGHIRKINPRDEDTDFGGAKDTLKHRILRRTNNYFDFNKIPIKGPHPVAFDRVKNVFQPTDEEKSHDRGLSFVSYMADIRNQFEFLQHDWANTTNEPTDGGNDFIIGQDPSIGKDPSIPDELKIKELPSVNLATPVTITKPIRFVTSKGMGYFLLPSISAIKEVICAPVKK